MGGGGVSKQMGSGGESHGKQMGGGASADGRQRRVPATRAAAMGRRILGGGATVPAGGMDALKKHKNVGQESPLPLETSDSLTSQTHGHAGFTVYVTGHGARGAERAPPLNMVYYSRAAARRHAMSGTCVAGVVGVLIRSATGAAHMHLSHHGRHFLGRTDVTISAMSGAASQSSAWQRTRHSIRTHTSSSGLPTMR
jgi:hypothetical protein